ncbi:MAG TPA: MMPL family transporter [Holophaga sp.]|nr:MMPL family transporter [Holophaga sp.]
MKRILRALVHLHLKRSAGLWIALAGITLLLGWGVSRVERRLDLMSLLPTDHPVVRASLEAGVGKQELLWLAAEGTQGDLEARDAWAEGLVERLLDQDGVPLNGLSGEGRLSEPRPVPEPKGVSLWPALLAAGSFLDGDAAAARLVTGQLYVLAPMLLGDRLKPLTDLKEVRARLHGTAAALASPNPVKARFARLDPLQLLTLSEQSDETLQHAASGLRNLPLKLRTGYLVTADGRYVLVPLVLDFPSSDTRATARVMTWLGGGAVGPLPARASAAQVRQALAPAGKRAFPLQITGAHAIAYWESQTLTREVLLSLGLSFVLIGLVYWIGFRTLAGYGFVVTPLLLGMLWALGLVGWLLGHLNLMAAAFGAVLLGVGDDVGILLFSRYRDERQAGHSKPWALRAALLGTGPGVVTAGTATALAFLACVVTPFPGFRDLGLTAGLGLLACMISSFLVLPALLIVFDRGKGTFAPCAQAGRNPASTVRAWKVGVSLALLLAGAWGIRRLTWEEDLRRFRQSGNPALALQQALGKALGAGLQPLAIQIPMDDPERLPQQWNRIVAPLRREGLPLPVWREGKPELKRILGSETWFREVLDIAAQEGLDPVALELPLSGMQESLNDPGAVPRSLQDLFPEVKVPLERSSSWSPFSWLKRSRPPEEPPPTFLLPLRLQEASLDRVEGEVTRAGARLVGTRPLFRAVKAVAKDALKDVILLAFGAVVLVVVFFGRSWRFLLLSMVPLVASQVGALGILGLSGEPLTFLSLVAIPIALGVSIDTAMNLLHRARLEPHAAARVARVNAVCAGTTLAGFGGLVFSGYRGLRGLGLAALGGVALALLVTQWVLPWMIERWPLHGRGRNG